MPQHGAPTSSTAVAAESLDRCAVTASSFPALTEGSLSLSVRQSCCWLIERHHERQPVSRAASESEKRASTTKRNCSVYLCCTFAPFLLGVSLLSTSLSWQQNCNFFRTCPASQTFPWPRGLCSDVDALCGIKEQSSHAGQSSIHLFARTETPK